MDQSSRSIDDLSPSLSVLQSNSAHEKTGFK